MSCSCNHKDVDNAAWVEETLIKFIKCLCSCGPSEPDETPSCIATFLTVRPIDGFPEVITYSKNGGPFKEMSLMDMEPDGLPSIVNMLKNESLTGFAFTMAEGESSTGFLMDFCGLNSDGAFVSSLMPDGIKPTELFMPNGIYPGPFNVIAEKNTLTFRASDGVPSYRDFFQCLDNPTGADTLSLESCSILEVLTDPLPPPR